MTNNFIGGADSYSAPPLDSYEPGKYAPSFLKPKPQQQQHQQQQHQNQQQHQHQHQQQQIRPQIQQQIIQVHRPAPQRPQQQYGAPQVKIISLL